MPNYAVLSASVCCILLYARFGRYFSDQQMPWRDTGENCDFGLEKAEDDGLL